jgi:hypothetical protein
MLLAPMPRLIQNLVCLPCRQPLVPKMDGQTAQFSQFGCKRLSLRPLRAHVAGKVHRISHHYSHYSKSTRQSRQGAKVLARAALPLQSQDRLRRQPQLIRHSYPDAAIADVESEIARLSFQCLFSLKPSGWLSAAILKRLAAE